MRVCGSHVLFIILLLTSDGQGTLAQDPATCGVGQNDAACVERAAEEAEAEVLTAMRAELLQVDLKKTVRESMGKSRPYASSTASSNETSAAQIDEVGVPTAPTCNTNTGGTCYGGTCDASRGAGTKCTGDGDCVCQLGYCAKNGKCELVVPMCDNDSGGTCVFGTCDQSRGPTVCKLGKCYCQMGYCLFQGKCVWKSYCERDTGGTCYSGPQACASSRGKTMCDSNSNKCLCMDGLCARDGKCIPR